MLGPPGLEAACVRLALPPAGLLLQPASEPQMPGPSCAHAGTAGGGGSAAVAWRAYGCESSKGETSGLVGFCVEECFQMPLHLKT